MSSRHRDDAAEGLRPLAIITREQAAEILAFLESELRSLARQPDARIWLEFSHRALLISPGMVAYLAETVRAHLAQVDAFLAEEAGEAGP